MKVRILFIEGLIHKEGLGQSDKAKEYFLKAKKVGVQDPKVIESIT